MQSLKNCFLCLTRKVMLSSLTVLINKAIRCSHSAVEMVKNSIGSIFEHVKCYFPMYNE